MDGLEDVRWVKVKTPFGEPSDAYCVGRLGEKTVIFLARHGRGHRILPTEINYRANIYGLKSLGATAVISVSAVGSMKEDIHPLDIVIPDQFFDHTKRRVSSFFGDGIVAHVGMADPVCRRSRAARSRPARGRAARGCTGAARTSASRGPQFSTRGESNVYRQLGRVGHRHDQHAGGQAGPRGGALLRDDGARHRLRRLARGARRGERRGGGREPHEERGDGPRRARPRAAAPPGPCTRGCPSALASAVITNPAAFPSGTRKRLGLLLDRYFPVAKKRAARG